MTYNRTIFTKGTEQYTDIDLSFKINPLTKDIRALSDGDSIKQALKVLLLTNYSERPFRPTVAGNVNRLLFEQYDQLTELSLRNDIIETIENHEPRVLLNDVKVVYNDLSVDITVKYSLQNDNSLQTINMMIQRIR